MPLIINLRHLAAQNVRLTGELPAAELDIDTRDEVIQLAGPLSYNLEVQKMENALLVQGSLRLALACQCVRCLKPFQYEVRLDPWTAHVPLEGEEAAPVVNDCVDLTPIVRQDILLEFPQHPVCEAECRGLPGSSAAGSNAAGTNGGESAWAELNKLKF